MCVSSVCTQPPYNDKYPPSVCFISSNVVDWHSVLPEWAVITTPLFHHQSRWRQERLLRDWMIIAVIIYSRHPKITFGFEGSAPSIYLNAFYMFTWIIRDLASSAGEVKWGSFMNLLQIFFTNNVLVSQFHSSDVSVVHLERIFNVTRRTSRLGEWFVQSRMRTILSGLYWN